MKITGTSLINHDIRIKLNLTLAEYCVMQFLFEWWQVNKKMPDIEALYKGIGITPKVFSEIGSQLSVKKLIDEDYKCTDKWNTHFKADITEFNRLWAIHDKGSKIKAKQRFVKVIKTITIDELESKLKAYIAYCDRCQVLKKNLDTWLNPVTKHWEDNLYVDKAMKPKEEPKKGIPFFLNK